MGMAEEDLLTTAVSIEGGTIRLTAERWRHITERHPELSGLRDEVMQAVADPSRLLDGNAGEPLAIREVEPGKVMWKPTRKVSPMVSLPRRF